MGEVFRASYNYSVRPSEFEIGEGILWWRKRNWFSTDEVCIQFSKIRSIDITTGLLFSTISVPWIGGPTLVSHGHLHNQVKAFSQALNEARNLGRRKEK